MRDVGLKVSIKDFLKVSYLIQLIFFIIAMEMYGNDWTKVQDHVRTRNAAQIRSHAQKYKLKVMYDQA
jgi:hypothetical protein